MKSSKISPCRTSKRAKQESPKKSVDNSTEPQRNGSPIFEKSSIECNGSNEITLQDLKCDDPASTENSDLTSKMIGESRADAAIWKEKRISSDGRKNGESLFVNEQLQSRSERENLVERWR